MSSANSGDLRIGHRHASPPCFAVRHQRRVLNGGISVKRKYSPNEVFFEHRHRMGFKFSNGDAGHDAPCNP